MIAQILSPFVIGTLNHKIEYQLSKIEDGVARELYNSSGDSLADMYRNMALVTSLNDRVKSPYIEFVLSSPIGERLSDEKFLEVSKEYMENMGYGNSYYTVIKNDDKDTLHVHILATTIDLDGFRISDSYSKLRSGKIMRELEIKYGLEIMEKGKYSCDKTLGEAQYRQYYFDTALHKALRSYATKTRLQTLLEQSKIYNEISSGKKSYTNTEWGVILGEDLYNNVFQELYKGKYFKSLFKDELLSVLDRLSSKCKNVNEFRNKIKEEGYYMRLVSDKGRSHYVYGLPDQSFYLKDSSLPMHYRYGNITFVGEQMAADEQKHYLYNKIFSVLHASLNYDDFKNNIEQEGIVLQEHKNERGVYGLSFSLDTVEIPEVFKSSEISRRLTYKNIQNYFIKEATEEQRTAIKPIVLCYSNNRQEWEREMNYMYPVMMGLLDDDGPRSHYKEDDELPNIKKKKKRSSKSKGLSY